MGYSWDTIGILLGYFWGTLRILLGYFWDTFGGFPNLHSRRKEKQSEVLDVYFILAGTRVIQVLFTNLTLTK